MKIAEIEKYITDDMLDAIYEGRFETLSFLDFVLQDSDCQQIEAEYPMDADDVCGMVRNLPDNFNEFKKKFNKLFDNYTVKHNLMTSYYSEQCYKVGFCDGMRTVLEILQEENSR